MEKRKVVSVYLWIYLPCRYLHGYPHIFYLGDIPTDIYIGGESTRQIAGPEVPHLCYKHVPNNCLHSQIEEQLGNNINHFEL